MKGLLLCVVVLAAVVSQGALEVKNVKLSQDWPWSNKVKLTYDLSGLAAGELAEVVVSATSGGKPLEMYAPGLTGDIYSLDDNDSYSISIDPVKAFGKGIEFIPDVRMSVTARAATSDSTNVLYKIFDIKNRSVVDVTRGALLNGEWGSVETDFGAIGPGYKTTLEDVVIWTGVTNDVAYKTTKLVVRKIPAGAFKGYKPGAAIPAENNMTWSFDYWIGVFEVTDGQRLALYNAAPNSYKLQVGSSLYKPKSLVPGETLPAQHISNYFLYGHKANRNGTTNVTDNTAGFMNYMRRRFTFDGVAEYDFELPTQVQWMRAMRAGADSYYYDGIGKTSSEVTVEQFNALACNLNNGGYMEHEDGSITTNIVSVGSFRPNAYGLYDTLGNIQELTREDKNLLTDQQWNDGGEDLIGAVTVLSGGTTRDSSLVGGAFDTASIGFAIRQVHGTSSTIATGFRVCMQSMADGIALITPKTE